MSEPIKVGDLVAVVRSCCVNYLDGHSVFVVGHIAMLPRFKSVTCECCKANLPLREPYASINDDECGCPVSWLKRIPPLDELERDQIVEELSNVR